MSKRSYTFLWCDEHDSRLHETTWDTWENGGEPIPAICVVGHRQSLRPDGASFCRWREVRLEREWFCVKGLKEYDCWQAVNMAPVEYSCGHEDCHEVWREVPDE